MSPARCDLAVGRFDLELLALDQDLAEVAAGDAEFDEREALAAFRHFVEAVAVIVTDPALLVEVVERLPAADAVAGELGRRDAGERAIDGVDVRPPVGKGDDGPDRAVDEIGRLVLDEHD